MLELMLKNESFPIFFEPLAFDSNFCYVISSFESYKWSFLVIEKVVNKSWDFLIQKVKVSELS